MYSGYDLIGYRFGEPVLRERSTGALCFESRQDRLLVELKSLEGVDLLPEPIPDARVDEG